MASLPGQAYSPISLPRCLSVILSQFDSEHSNLVVQKTCASVPRISPEGMIPSLPFSATPDAGGGV
jgi:hypothetical protein